MIPPIKTFGDPANPVGRRLLLVVRPACPASGWL